MWEEVLWPRLHCTAKGDLGSRLAHGWKSVPHLQEQPGSSPEQETVRKTHFLGFYTQRVELLSEKKKKKSSLVFLPVWFQLILGRSCTPAARSPLCFDRLCLPKSEILGDSSPQAHHPTTSRAFLHFQDLSRAIYNVQAGRTLLSSRPSTRFICHKSEISQTAASQSTSVLPVSEHIPSPAGFYDR